MPSTAKWTSWSLSSSWSERDISHLKLWRALLNQRLREAIVWLWLVTNCWAILSSIWWHDLVPLKAPRDCSRLTGVLSLEVRALSKGWRSLTNTWQVWPAINPMVLSLRVWGGPSTQELLAISCRDETPVSDMLQVIIVVTWTFLCAGFCHRYDFLVRIFGTVVNPKALWSRR